MINNNGSLDMVNFEQCFDLPAFRAEVGRLGLSKRKLAIEMGMCYASLLKKMAGKAPFKTTEILKFKSLFKLNSKELGRMFFKEKNDKILA